ncbi:hypothetical protein N0M98_30255 [Paenibacillus doosanensis]|uniref:Nicotianamine synthase protein n=1 Tax=Paenibacillus konkukensis TaxID=2020716 RepID=A0ABY4RNJ5_9BACL|nr:MULTISPECIES: nicotianamine synthase family protein [Paenibacillus]MCS7464389.1 hypothetical protein [Paenibacillus doosanensis]UQZ83284.1 Nicotianamine synthase protein [Paenibacillus konkukensis]
MKDKDEFLLSIKKLDDEIKELTYYSKQDCGCFELLQHKLDHLCQFMNCEKNKKRWNQWASHPEISDHSAELRESSVKALCDVEKYQSHCICRRELDISRYLEMLSHSVKQEISPFGMGPTSKVLFIGSGALPVSALTIAKELCVEVMCVDIDMEAVILGRRVAEASGLDSLVSFSNQSLRELDFVKQATHIWIASLVKNKLEVIQELRDTMNPAAKIILRYGNGLKSVFNYPLEESFSEEWVQTPISQEQSIYDTMILEKAEAMRFAMRHVVG